MFYYIYLTSINVSNVITFFIFELTIYAAFNLSWIKNTNAYSGFTFTSTGYMMVSKAITAIASHGSTDVNLSIS
jgi:hypothetical protein